MHELVDNVEQGAVRHMIPRERHYHVKGPVSCMCGGILFPPPLWDVIRIEEC